jgi:hypothetical protein
MQNVFYHLLDFGIHPEFTIKMGNRYPGSTLICVMSSGKKLMSGKSKVAELSLFTP